MALLMAVKLAEMSVDSMVEYLVVPMEQLRVGK